MSIEFFMSILFPDLLHYNIIVSQQTPPLQGAVRQASLSCLRSECHPAEVIPSDWSRRNMATKLEEGVAATVAISWRGLGIGGVARYGTCMLFYIIAAPCTAIM